jgi:hypothetical protein
MNLAVAKDKVEHGYRQEVRIEWTPVKIDQAGNRRSDFLGYVVMRKSYGDASNNYELLTPWALTSTNYYYDRLPDTSVNQFTYRIAAVDSSYNCSAEDTVDVSRPPLVKPSFPIRTAAIMKAPSIGNHDKSATAGIYTIAGATNAVAMAFRSNGQESVVKGINDGVIVDTNALQAAMGDLNDDGFDDAVLVTDSTLVAWDMRANSLLWSVAINDGSHKPSVSCFRKPLLADIDGNGKLEIIIFIVDNNGGISSLDAYAQNGSRLARRVFLDYCYAPAVAVGEFSRAHAGLEILLVARVAGSIPSTDDVTLYVLDKNLTTISSAVVSTWYSDAQSGKTVNVNGALAVGNCYGDTSYLEVVMSKGKASWSSAEVLDTLMACRVATATGTIVQSGGKAQYAMYPVTFAKWTIFGSSPALADIDGDGVSDIVFATDDSLYVLKMAGQDSIVPLVRTAFGHLRSNRLSGNGFTPQPIVADVNGQKRVFINHQGDGNIWAFDIKPYGYLWYASLTPGYPLKTRGRVSEACAVSDLDGDGMLDLTAADDAGYLYAWQLDSSSMYHQPWPVSYGNNWNTSFTGYKDAGAVGYLYEDWKAERVAPYRWLETQTGNSRTENVGTPAFIRDDGVYKTQQAGDRNSHFTGLGTGNSYHYTVSGTMKFDNASAEFGVNFYSQWPAASAKYTLMRKSTGAVHLYCYHSWAPTIENDQGAVYYPSLDTIVANLTGTWYHYEIRVDNDSSKMYVKWWKEGTPKPDNAGLEGWFDGYMLPYGSVGVTTHAGSGYRYWGPITVLSSTPEGGANIAYEHFTKDAIVDITPYTPENWSAEYGSTRFATGYDTSGFVFNAPYTALMYKHKVGSRYPVTCNIAPYTNLAWRDYAFSGKMVKPVGVVYDSIWLGMDVYSVGGKGYHAKFRNDTMKVSGGGIAETVVNLGAQFDSGDSLKFKVTVRTAGTATNKDSVTYLSIEAGINGSSLTSLFDNHSSGDTTPLRIKEGVPAVYIDLNGKENSATGAIRIDDVVVQKINE